VGKLSKLGKLGEPARAHVLPGSFWNESAGYVPLPSKGEAERQPGPRNADTEMGANPCPGRARSGHSSGSGYYSALANRGWRSASTQPPASLAWTVDSWPTAVSVGRLRGDLAGKDQVYFRLAWPFYFPLSAGLRLATRGGSHGLLCIWQSEIARRWLRKSLASQRVRNPLHPAACSVQKACTRHARA
jgi:hypothetical protein